MNNPTLNTQIPGCSPRASAAFDNQAFSDLNSYALYNRKKQDIQYVEELSLNAWPSHKIELYDGWLIRFSNPISRSASCSRNLSMSAFDI